MYVAPIYRSLVINYLFIYSYLFIFIIIIVYSSSSFFSLFSFFFFSLLIDCFNLFNYQFFLPLFLFLFIGLAYCVSTAIQVFLLARKFNINIKYSTKNIIWLYGKNFNCKLYNGEKYIYFYFTFTIKYVPNQLVKIIQTNCFATFGFSACQGRNVFPDMYRSLIIPHKCLRTNLNLLKHK